MTAVTEARAALERGRHVVLVLPPAVEHAGVVWEIAPSGPTVICCADPAAAGEWAAAAAPLTGRRVHPVTGLARSARLLGAGGVDVLAGAAKDLAALLARSALKLETLSTLIVAWPEALIAGGEAALLDTLLAEAKDARRLFLTWDPAQLTDFFARHAYRAPTFGTPPVDADGRPAPPVGPASYAVTPAHRRLEAVRDTLDALDPARALVWTPLERDAGRLREELDAGVTVASTVPEGIFEAVICAALPTRQEFAALSRLGEPVVLATAGQLAYLRRLAAPLKPLRLPTAADRARDRAEALRERIAQLVRGAQLDRELALLDPVFARFDAAEVAAALLALSDAAAASPTTPPGSGPSSAPPSWVKVFVNVGRKDRAAAKDLVGALIREAGLAKDAVGRIDVRETFSIVEVAAGAAAQAVRGLTGVLIRGRRAQARLDRHA